MDPSRPRTPLPAPAAAVVVCVDEAAVLAGDTSAADPVAWIAAHPDTVRDALAMLADVAVERHSAGAAR